MTQINPTKWLNQFRQQHTLISFLLWLLRGRHRQRWWWWWHLLLFCFFSISFIRPVLSMLPTPRPKSELKALHLSYNTLDCPVSVERNSKTEFLSLPFGTVTRNRVDDVTWLKEYDCWVSTVFTSRRPCPHSTDGWFVVSRALKWFVSTYVRNKTNKKWWKTGNGVVTGWKIENGQCCQKCSIGDINMTPYNNKISLIQFMVSHTSGFHELQGWDERFSGAGASGVGKLWART